MDADVFINVLREGLGPTLNMHDLAYEMSILQQDNDPKHTSKKAKDYIKSLNLSVLHWSSCSPDLNPIEHVWSNVKMRLYKRIQKSKNKEVLIAAIKEEWYSTPLEYIQALYNSMPARIAAVKTAHGGHSKY
ncbi:hypothetical protein ENBRE01_2202 [Enteropsectra breve]|nr:hypothetical protein ENBRE01_2202 [Enteropsectra breve]